MNEALTLRALGHFQKAEFIEARSCFEAMLEQDPRNLDAIHYMAIIQKQLGDIDDALRLFDRALAIDPNRADVLNNRGVTLHDLNRFEESVESYRRAIDLAPDYAQAHNNLGAVLKELGQMAAAKESYDRAVALDPTDADFFYNRGQVLATMNRNEDAIADYDTAIGLRPSYPECFNNRGNALKALGLFDEALCSYTKAISLAPTYADGYYNRGVLHHELGSFEQAVCDYQSAIRYKPSHADAFNNCGNSLRQLKRFEEAVRCYEKAIHNSPMHSDAHYNRGVVLADLKRYSEALGSYDQAVQINPNHYRAYNNRGNVLHALGQYEDAEASFNASISINPTFAEAYCNRGNFLREMKRGSEAIKDYDEALRIRPDFAPAFNNRAVALEDLDALDEALHFYDHAIRIDPTYPEPNYNRANLLRNLGRYEEALDGYVKATVLKPEYAEAHWNRSLLLLLLGDYETGWPLYEWRMKTEEHGPSYVHFQQPAWRGESDIGGKQLLIYTEQGLGDFIQFVRYVPLIEEAWGAKIVLEVPGSLKTLISTMPVSMTIIRKGDPLPAFDVHCPIMSLPYVFRTGIDTIPNKVPYMFADPARTAVWEARLGQKRGLRIGLAWSGSFAHKNDSNRSISVATLGSLFELAVEWHSLQKEYREEDLELLKRTVPVHQHESELSDFSDTAALIACMDLVISVDTSVAHLAGALGKPTWVLLPHVPDFRWMLHREDTPWYPTVRLFRQDENRQWQPVIDRIVAEVSALSERAKTELKEVQVNQQVTRPVAFVTAATKHGTMIVNRFDYLETANGIIGVGAQLLAHAAYDPEEVDLSLKLLSLRRKHHGEGVFALDCGANIGVHTLEWARFMAGWGEVLAFEAQERVFYALAGNLALNNCFNARACWAAIGEQSGSIGVPVPNYQRPSSFGSLELRHRSNTEYIGQSVGYEDDKLQRVQLLAIDQLNLQRVDLIKVDVEGMEEEVLTGAMATISRTKPILVIERIKSDQDALKACLSNWGYQVYDVGMNYLAIHSTDPCASHVNVRSAGEG